MSAVFTALTLGLLWTSLKLTDIQFVTSVFRVLLIII